jgi:hypothetical protein
MPSLVVGSGGNDHPSAQSSQPSDQVPVTRDTGADSDEESSVGAEDNSAVEQPVAERRLQPRSLRRETQ